MNNEYSNELLPPPSGLFLIPDLIPVPSHAVYLSLVIPTYNEGKNINKIIRVLSDVLDEVIPENYELIVVDDNSPDRTWQIAQSLMPQYPHLRVMRRRNERGLSTAVLRGWQVANGQILGAIDGDLQHPPEILLKLLVAIDRGADLAVASRHVEQGGVSDWNLLRRSLSRGAQLLGLVLLPGIFGRVSDPMSGYFMVRRNAITGCTMNPLGYKILIEVLSRGKISQIAEVGYVFQERQEGNSKVSWKHYIDYLGHLLRLRLSLGQFGRLIRFGFVGLGGVFVDMAVLYLLHDTSTLSLGLTRSKILAAEVAIINNFIWNDTWTFSDVSSQQSGWNQRFKRLLKFNLVCLMGLILNVLLLNLLFNIIGLHYLLANLIAIVSVTLWNFWINLKLSWRAT
ncbi:MAG: sulfonate ABC transporter permease [Cyanobacteria bacterium QS_4_48_99]|nr:MAG: sulfonate ABC transporter permease [Cyanobacteria bacterium QS_4_48_99]